MRKIDSIWVHCTASAWGDLDEITRWHKQRGWSDLGYHYLITNIFPTYSSYKDGPPEGEFDGALWIGRPIVRMGSHVRGQNAHSIGIAMVGYGPFSSNQIGTLVKQCANLCTVYNIPVDRVWGHYEYWTRDGLAPKKPCPEVNMDEIRKRVGEELREREKCHLEAHTASLSDDLPLERPGVCHIPDPYQASC